MAGAVVAEHGNGLSIFHNPAGITEIDGMSFSAGGGHLYGFSWLPAYHLSGIISWPLLGHIGIGLQQFETKFNDLEM